MTEGRKGFNVGSKATLSGELTTERFQCTCCTGLDILRVLNVEKNETKNYCNPCFTSNCKCNGKDLSPVTQ